MEDVDRLFSCSLIAWMEKKSYTPEAEYLRIVHNWRRACDERGVTNDERSKFNKEFLIYLLDDLMPYHRDEGLNDLSLLEVNRYTFRLPCILKLLPYIVLTQKYHRHQRI